MKNRAKRQEKLLREIEQEHGNVSSACRIVGVDRDTFYEWRNNDAEFLKRYLEVQERLLEQIDAILLDRALNAKSTPALIALGERVMRNVKDLEELDALKSLHKTKVARHGTRYE